MRAVYYSKGLRAPAAIGGFLTKWGRERLILLRSRTAFPYGRAKPSHPGKAYSLVQKQNPNLSRHEKSGFKLLRTKLPKAI
jgi:hypothetical protein